MTRTSESFLSIFFFGSSPDLKSQIVFIGLIIRDCACMRAKRARDHMALSTFLKKISAKTRTHILISFSYIL